MGTEADSCLRLSKCETPVKDENVLDVEADAVKHMESESIASNIVRATFWFKQHPAKVCFSPIYHIL